MEDFEHGLYSILTDSADTPEQDISLDETDALPSSVLLGYLHLVNTVSDTSGLQVAASIKSHTLWCQARTLLLSVPQACKTVASRLFHYFARLLHH